SQLTPVEAAHLASVTPNPKGYWARFHRGPAGDDWMEKLYDLLGMMHRSHRLSDEDFAAAMAANLPFIGLTGRPEGEKKSSGVIPKRGQATACQVTSC